MRKPDEAGKNRRAVLFVFLASVCFSTGGLFIKLVPWSALAINGARNLIGAAVIGLYLLITRRRIIFNRRVLIGVHESNTASRRTAENCGGVLENIVRLEDDPEPVCRYWIDNE